MRRSAFLCFGLFFSFGTVSLLACFVGLVNMGQGEVMKEGRLLVAFSGRLLLMMVGYEEWEILLRFLCRIVDLMKRLTLVT